MIERALQFYERVITSDFVRTVRRSADIVEREGIYQSSIVLWLMIFQRLKRGTLAEAVEELRLGSSGRLLERAKGSIRARTRRISGHTGGLSQARERLPLAVVEAASDALHNEIIASTTDSAELSKRVYIIDGSTIRTMHTKSNLKKFPQFENQYGAAHFPLVRISIATHALSGVALRPAHGPFNGEDAVGELTLAWIPSSVNHLSFLKRSSSSGLSRTILYDMRLFRWVTLLKFLIDDSASLDSLLACRLSAAQSLMSPCQVT